MLGRESTRANKKDHPHTTGEKSGQTEGAPSRGEGSEQNRHQVGPWTTLRLTLAIHVNLRRERPLNGRHLRQTGVRQASDRRPGRRGRQEQGREASLGKNS